MSIVFKKGSIFEENVSAIVNPVNCVGVMGKGLALEFKRRYRDNYLFYRENYDSGNLKIGTCLVFEIPNATSNLKYIINFPTKKHWRDNSKLDYIISGLIDLKAIIKNLQLSSIAIPSLGCGLGGLDWEEVSKVIISNLEGLETHLVLFEPI